MVSYAESDDEDDDEILGANARRRRQQYSSKRRKLSPESDDDEEEDAFSIGMDTEEGAVSEGTLAHALDYSLFGLLTVF